MRAAKNRHFSRWVWAGGAYVISGLLVFPIYWLLVTSLRPPDQLRGEPTLVPTELYFGGYLSVLADSGFQINLLNSLTYGLGAMVTGLVLGAGVAYVLVRVQSRVANGILLSMLVFQAFPGIMLALPLFVMFAQMGLINTQVAVILALGTKTVPFTAVMLRPFIAGIPIELEQAAMLDGATRPRVLASVVLPLALPGLVTISAFNFVTGWGDLLFSFTLLTDQTLQPISVGLYRYMGLYGVDWNQLMAASVLAAIPAVIVFAFSQRFLVSGALTGATNE